MPPTRPWTALLFAACTSHTPGEPPPVRDVVIVHELCDQTPRAVAPIDTTALVVHAPDPDCITMDLTGDGKPDLYSYHDARGQLRRTESDFNGDGELDQIDHYEAGSLVRRDRDLDFDQKLDSWEFHARDRVVRREHDSDGDGRVDRWWTYKDDACPQVEADNDGDGRPDPDSRAVVCP